MSSAGTRIRAMTWNVHACVGSAGTFDPDAIVAAVRKAAPDIVALQEIDAREALAGGIDTFGYLRRALGWRVVEARTIRTDRGDYGHAVMSPWTVELARCIDLSVAGFEPRTAISCGIREFGVHVIATHLGLRGRERRTQVQAIIEEVERHRERPLIVLGDFNEWRRNGLATRMLCPPFREAAARASFPAWRPVFALDRIWCSPPLEPVSAEASDHVARLSDHLPIVAELRMPPGRPAVDRRSATSHDAP